MTFGQMVVQASSCGTVQQREKDGSKRNVECPPLLPDYQSFMREWTEEIN